MCNTPFLHFFLLSFWSFCVRVLRHRVVEQEQSALTRRPCVFLHAPVSLIKHFLLYHTGLNTLTLTRTTPTLFSHLKFTSLKNNNLLKSGECKRQQREYFGRGHCLEKTAVFESVTPLRRRGDRDEVKLQKINAATSWVCICTREGWAREGHVLFSWLPWPRWLHFPPLPPFLPFPWQGFPCISACKKM